MSGPDRWAVSCRCDKHGDHMACDDRCQTDLGCRHPVGEEITAATEAEADWLSGLGPRPVSDTETRDLSWVTEIKTVDADDSAVHAFVDNPGWLLLHTGAGAAGQTTLTFAWPFPDGFTEPDDDLVTCRDCGARQTHLVCEDCFRVRVVSDRIPDGEWDVHVWEPTHGNHTPGRVDVADRKRLLQVILEAAKGLPDRG